jgi:hypothetical protein
MIRVCTRDNKNDALCLKNMIFSRTHFFINKQKKPKSPNFYITGHLRCATQSPATIRREGYSSYQYIIHEGGEGITRYQRAKKKKIEPRKGKVTQTSGSPLYWLRFWDKAGVPSP